jgi:dipeptidyl aminopeptidase/acylaminoacyl peptidase
VGGNEKESSRVRAVMDLCGPVDFEAAGRMDARMASNPNNPVFRLLGGSPLEKRDLARLASPLRHVTKDDPPFFILHGDKDTTVPVDQARALDAACRKAGVPSTLVIADGVGHGANALLKAPEHEKAIADFLNQHLR